MARSVVNGVSMTGQAPSGRTVVPVVVGVDVGVIDMGFL
jgi:hypothetical protein